MQPHTPESEGLSMQVTSSEVVKKKSKRFVSSLKKLLGVLQASQRSANPSQSSAKTGECEAVVPTGIANVSGLTSDVLECGAPSSKSAPRPLTLPQLSPDLEPVTKLLSTQLTTQLSQLTCASETARGAGPSETLERPPPADAILSPFAHPPAVERGDSSSCNVASSSLNPNCNAPSGSLLQGLPSGPADSPHTPNPFAKHSMPVVPTKKHGLHFAFPESASAMQPSTYGGSVIGGSSGRPLLGASSVRMPGQHHHNHHHQHHHHQQHHHQHHHYHLHHACHTNPASISDVLSTSSPSSTFIPPFLPSCLSAPRAISPPGSIPHHHSTPDGEAPYPSPSPTTSAPAAAPPAPAPPASSSSSTLLAVCPGAPESMRRPVWRLLDYNITGRLYKGEVSAVYKAVCQRSNARVVLKVYSLARVAENVLHTLVREIEIQTSLAHRNILMLYGVFEEDNRLVLVLERASRGDLFHLHRSLPNCRMSEEQLRVLVLAPLLEALAYLHARGVCHRDVKPENLLMTATWQLRLADFGAAINMAQERAVTRTGTADYMAPEVERCPLKALPEDNKDKPDLAYTTAADVWSVGVLAYEMIVGFPPFITCTQPDPASAQSPSHSSSGPRELSFPHFASAGAQDFISAALAERAGDRPTAAQLLRHPWLKQAARQPSLPQ